MELTPKKPIAGLLAPLFALRGSDDLGIGDTQALREFVGWAAAYGFRLVQLLPINETGHDNSPYNAISSIAIAPTTICTVPEHLPDLLQNDYDEILANPINPANADLASLRAGPVDYPSVKNLKHRLLEKAFENFSKKHFSRRTKRAREFKEFANDEAAWLDGYAFFRALMELHGTECWDRWAPEQHTLQSARRWLLAKSSKARKPLELRIRFFKYVQWIAFSQWRALKKDCEKKGVALMGDVPFGVSYYSADVFSEPGIFNLDWSGGAPPEKVFKSDPFTEKWGQNWGIPLYRWDVLAEQNYGWWRQRVSKIRSIFDLFRIDHILGFYRIYSFPWRPEENENFLLLEGDQARERTGGRLPEFHPNDDSNWENSETNRRAGEHYLRVLLEETGAHRLIGEDLGMVPDYVRPNLESLGIAGFKIPQWEDDGNGGLPDGASYQRLSVTTYATHDHPPLMAMWNALYDDAVSDDPHRSGHARWEMERLARFAKLEIPLPCAFTPEVHETLLDALLRSNSWLAIFMITDLFGTEQRFNVPGAVANSNWSERLSQPISEWNDDDDLRKKMERMQTLIHAANREG